MPISQHLLRKLQETLGAEAADDLVSWIEDMDANRGDVGELRHEMQLGFARVDARFERLEGRFEKLEARFESFEAKFAGLEGKMTGLFEKGLREQTRFFFLAWSVLLAVIVGLYAR
jgi:predicted nuclease with TOPRIM domain